MSSGYQMTVREDAVKGELVRGMGRGVPRTQTEKTEIAQDMVWQETADFRGLEISCREFGFGVQPKIPRTPRKPVVRGKTMTEPMQKDKVFFSGCLENAV